MNWIFNTIFININTFYINNYTFYWYTLINLIINFIQSWDDIYKRDNKNFEDFGDIGDSWFGEESVVKMVDWVIVK